MIAINAKGKNTKRVIWALTLNSSTKEPTANTASPKISLVNTTLSSSCCASSRKKLITAPGETELLPSLSINGSAPGRFINPPSKLRRTKELIVKRCWVLVMRPVKIATMRANPMAKNKAIQPQTENKEEDFSVRVLKNSRMIMPGIAGSPAMNSHKIVSTQYSRWA